MMTFPVDILNTVNPGSMEQSAKNYMYKLLCKKSEIYDYISVPGSEKHIEINICNVNFVSLYGVDIKEKILAVFSSEKPLDVFGFYLLDRWWSVEDILKTSDSSRTGLIQVRTTGERIVLYVLNRIIYRTEDNVNFPCHGEDEVAKILWRNGNAIGFYSVKPEVSVRLNNRFLTQRYHLPVMDTVFIRKCHRRHGHGLQMLKDFVTSFRKDFMGLSNPLSPAMYKVCQKYLSFNPDDMELLWECVCVGSPFQTARKVQATDENLNSHEVLQPLEHQHVVEVEIVKLSSETEEVSGEEAGEQNKFQNNVDEMFLNVREFSEEKVEEEKDKMTNDENIEVGVNVGKKLMVENIVDDTEEMDVEKEEVGTPDVSFIGKEQREKVKDNHSTDMAQKSLQEIEEQEACPNNKVDKITVIQEEENSDLAFSSDSKGKRKRSNYKASSRCAETLNDQEDAESKTSERALQSSTKESRSRSRSIKSRMPPDLVKHGEVPENELKQKEEWSQEDEEQINVRTDLRDQRTNIDRGLSEVVNKLDDVVHMVLGTVNVFAESDPLFVRSTCDENGHLGKNYLESDNHENRTEDKIFSKDFIHEETENMCANTSGEESAVRVELAEYVNYVKGKVQQKRAAIDMVYGDDAMERTSTLTMQEDAVVHGDVITTTTTTTTTTATVETLVTNNEQNDEKDREDHLKESQESTAPAQGDGVHVIGDDEAISAATGKNIRRRTLPVTSTPTRKSRLSQNIYNKTKVLQNTQKKISDEEDETVFIRYLRGRTVLVTPRRKSKHLTFTEKARTSVEEVRGTNSKYDGPVQDEDIPGHDLEKTEDINILNTEADLNQSKEAQIAHTKALRKRTKNIEPTSAGSSKSLRRQDPEENGGQTIIQTNTDQGKGLELNNTNSTGQEIFHNPEDQEIAEEEKLYKSTNSTVTQDITEEDTHGKLVAENMKETMEGQSLTENIMESINTMTECIEEKKKRKPVTQQTPRRSQRLERAEIE